METEHKAVRQAALDCLINFPENSVVRDQFAMSGVAKFLKKRGSENTRHVVSVMKKYRPHLNQLDVYAKTRLLHFILPGKPAPSDSLEFTKELCESMRKDLHRMRLKDLEQFTFCLFFLNHKIINESVAADISNSVMKCNWADVRSGRSYVFLICFLARMGRIEIEHINQIIEKANQCQMKNLNTDSGLASAIEFLFQLNMLSASVPSSTTYIMKFIQHNRYLRNALL